MRKVMVLVVGVAVLAAGSAGSGGAAPAKTLKVGMVTDASGLNDRGFNHLAYVGLQQAQKRLGDHVPGRGVAVTLGLHPEPRGIRPPGL